MALDKRTVELARHEVLSPTLRVSKELLEVHKPILVDNVPLIARTDETREPGAFYFYFRLEDEPYYLVVVVRPEGKAMAVAGAYVEAAIRVFLLVKSEELSAEEITQRLGLEPTTSQPKGERLHEKLKPLTQTRWQFEPDKDLPEELGRKLDLLLDQLEGARERIAKLAKECHVAIHICYEGYKEWMGGWVVQTTTFRRIAELGVHVELDLYACGPDPCLS